MLLLLLQNDSMKSETINNHNIDVHIINYGVPLRLLLLLLEPALRYRLDQGRGRSAAKPMTILKLNEKFRRVLLTSVFTSAGYADNAQGKVHEVTK